ncbi:MAG: putative portal protein [Prokaryotic dsDNA virus sp.]|nr:hypothetical protein [Aequorivita sp.]QDP57317.1 MAG: putative portal protein [Prokaryotic dsDNA virus sp.]|tara:strand:+ start:3865 stop:5610 length:1746 start_codon:yes stop_codon:yes gene_type:complete
MARLSFTQVQQIRNQLIVDRSRHLETWRKRAKMMSPNRFNNNPSDKNRGQRKDQDIINSQVRRSLRTFVSGMMNGATSRARPWFKLISVDESKGNSTAARRWFADVERIILAHMQVSNLYRVLPMAYKDVGVFSNAAYGMLPHDRFGFHFQPFTIGSYCIANDSEGNVTTFMRDFNLSIRQVIETYADETPSGQIDWSKFDPWIKDSWDNQRYQDTVNLVVMIVPNKAPKENPLFPEDRAYQSYTYVNGSGSNVNSSGSRTSLMSFSNKFLSVKGYDYFPVIAPRWEVAPEEDYGDESPGCLAEGDCNTLQELERANLEAVDKLIRPPMVGPAALRRSQASILAGGITYLDEQDSTKQFRPAFTVEPKISELLNQREETRQAIRSAFFEDLFKMLSDEKTVSHVSAREIEEKAAEKLSAIGPILGQLDQDQNRRLVENSFRLLMAQGKLPPKPPELEGAEIRPEYISILAQAQKASLITSTEKLVAFVAQSAEAFKDPSLLKLIKPDLMVRQYADYLGVDPALIRDELEYEQIQEAQAAVQAQAQAQATQAQAASTAKDLSQAKVGEGGLLDQFAGAQQAV